MLGNVKKIVNVVGLFLLCMMFVGQIKPFATVYGDTVSGDWVYDVHDEYTNEGSAKYLILTGYQGNASKVIVPKTIDGIPVDGMERTFRYCHQVYEVVVEGDIRVSNAPFDGCDSLKKIIINGEMPDFSVNNCSSLETIALNGVVKFIDTHGSVSVSGCKKLEDFIIRKIEHVNGAEIDLRMVENSCLKEMTIPEGVTHAIFEKCDSLQRVSIPETIETINGFPYCYQLSDIYYAGSECQWKGIIKHIEGSASDKINQAMLHFSKVSVHQYGEWEIEEIMTFIWEGIKRRQCLICGEEEVQYIPKVCHHMYTEWKVTKEATCKERGILERWCMLCGYGEKKNTDTVAEHFMGNWVITKKPTLFSDGEKERSCIWCGGEKQTELIPKTQSYLIVENRNIKLAKTKSVSLKIFFTAGDSVKVKSSNKKIATASYVSGNIIVKAKKKAGTTNIIVTTKTGKKTIIKVTVPKVKTKKITCKAVSVKKGKKVTLKPKVTPTYSDDKVTYKSANKKVATVTAKGVVKGIKKGKTIIIIKSGKKSVKVKVIVK